MIRRRHHTAGFTFVEMLVSLVLSALVIAGLLAAFSHHRKSYSTVNQVVDMQQNLRAAMERVSRDVRMAGYGVLAQDSELSQWFTWVAGVTNRVLLNQGGTAADPDEITVLGAFDPPVAQVVFGTSPGDTTIIVTAGAGSEFNTLDRKIILIGKLEMARVVRISGDKMAISTDPVVAGAGLTHGYPSGTDIELVQAITYRTGVNTNEVPELLFIMREDNAPSPPPIIDRMVAAHVENFQVMPQGSNSVLLEVTARTHHADEDYDHPTEHDGYRRESLQARALLRNPARASSAPPVVPGGGWGGGYDDDDD